MIQRNASHHLKVKDLLIIREERESDIHKVHELNSAAFETNAEALLVDSLRNACSRFISLVAEQENQIIGHILFTPVELSGENSGLNLMGLAPMAVLPSYQNMGIGSKLVEEGLSQCNTDGVDAVFVLGHPRYYPKFGFTPASEYGIGCEYDAPDEAFMVIEIKSGILNGKVGTVRYNKAFEGL